MYAHGQQRQTLYADGAPLDVSRVSPKLYVGSLPPAGRGLGDAGFQVLVLCAEPEEYVRVYGSYDRALDLRFDGLKVFRAPLDDQWPNAYQPVDLGRPTEQQMLVVYEAAAQVAIAVHRGQRVLVTCMKGRNRSAFVVALALHRLTGWSGDLCAEHVRLHRRPDVDGDVLCNPWFDRILSNIAAHQKPSRALEVVPQLRSSRAGR